MNINKYRIVVDDDDDRQLLYDAMLGYCRFCQDMAKSHHVGAAEFGELAERADWTLVAMWEAWPDLRH